MELIFTDNEISNELYKELKKGIESLERGKKYSPEEVYNELENI